VAVDSTRVADVDARREALSEGGFPERDDVFSQLVNLPGFRILEYRGVRVELDLELESVRLMGEAQANYEEAVLRADSITYLARSRFISALGRHPEGYDLRCRDPVRGSRSDVEGSGRRHPGGHGYPVCPVG
jgi:hypothetical protein